jgi:hypothetical protein
LSVHAEQLLADGLRQVARISEIFVDGEHIGQTRRAGDIGEPVIEISQRDIVLLQDWFELRRSNAEQRRRRPEVLSRRLG